MTGLPRDFYEVQKSQRARSLFLFGVVLLFYLLAIGLVALTLVWSFGLALSRETIGAPHFWTRFLLFDFAAATLVAVLHFQDARRNGARYILRRLQAATPDPADRYHNQFLNTVDEIRIAAGLPRVNAYVLPSFAVNSLALIEESGTPAVAVTEGLLAEGTRDELQAVAAHELAHIARGDAFYMTLVCSLANLFEKLKEALEPEEEGAGTVRSGRGDAGGGPPVLFYLAVTLSALAMRLLSALISRERELLADAAAVEICRSPESLVRAIYKAQVQNSFVGDFSVTYTPLFIVRPDSRDTSEGILGRIFSSHPPLMKRLALISAMAHKSPDTIIRDVWEGVRTRARARGVLLSFEEAKRRQLELFPDEGGTAGPTSDGGGEGPAAGTVPGSPDVRPCPAASALPADEARIWQISAPPPRRWDGPFSMGELLCHPRFSLLMRIGNIQEGVEAKAREFPQVRLALKNISRKTPIAPGRANLCPRCRVPLVETFYEGIPIRSCTRCRGRLVDMGSVDRIIVRREVRFSEGLLSKARAFRERVLLNPLKKQKAVPGPGKGVDCPNCGWRMVERPYNYQYFIAVDKCLSCSKIWFDSDELEILQALIEDARR